MNALLRLHLRKLRSRQGWAGIGSLLLFGGPMLFMMGAQHAILVLMLPSAAFFFSDPLSLDAAFLRSRALTRRRIARAQLAQGTVAPACSVALLVLAWTAYTRASASEAATLFPAVVVAALGGARYVAYGWDGLKMYQWFSLELPLTMAVAVILFRVSQVTWREVFAAMAIQLVATAIIVVMLERRTRRMDAQ